jgi:hypothetical protein
MGIMIISMIAIFFKISTVFSVCRNPNTLKKANPTRHISKISSVI